MPCTSQGMLLALIAAITTEPLPVEPAAIPDSSLVTYTLFGCVAAMALFTAAYAYGTRPKEHRLRVVRRPR